MPRIKLQNRVAWLLAGVAVLIAPPLPCAAQEAGSLDLTQIEARTDLRRPPARLGDPPDRRGMNWSIGGCDSSKNAASVRATLVSLDRSEYREGDAPRFEVRITNVGLTPIKIPFSPHLSDFQPADAGGKFAYWELSIGLWLIGGKAWSSNTGGGSAMLYGSDAHPETMLTLPTR